MALLARVYIEDMATPLGHVGWCVQVYRDGEVAALVPNAMHAELVGHVCHGILPVHPLRYDTHRLVLVAFGEGVPSLGEVALEYLHQAVGLGVVVDGTALAGGPDKDELFVVSEDAQLPGDGLGDGGASGRCRQTYQIALSISFIDQVSGVSTAFVAHGIPRPVALVGYILFHQPGQLGDVDIIRRQTR